MADFNPFLEEKDPNYLRNSQGTSRAQDADIKQLPGTQVIDFGSQKANTAVGDLIGNLTKTGAGIISATEDIIKQKASTLAREGVEAYRTAFTGDVSSSLERVTGQPSGERGSDTILGNVEASSPVTQSIAANIDRKGTQLNSARAGRNMTEANYWVQLEEFASSLRERFPGHKDFIDSKIAQYSGGNPANKIWQLKLAALTDLAQKASSNADATNKYIEHNAQYMPAEMRTNWFSGDPSKKPSANEAMLAIKNNQGQKERLDRAAEELTVMGKQQQLQDRSVRIMAEDLFADHTRKAYDEIMGSPKGQEIRALIDKGVNISADETAKVAEFQSSVTERMAQQLHQLGSRGIYAETTVGEDGQKRTRYYGESIRSRLGDDYPKVVERALSDFRAMEGKIYKDPTSLIPFLKGWNDMKTDEKVRNVLGRYNSFDMLSILGKVGGPVAQQTYLGSGGGSRTFQQDIESLKDHVISMQTVTGIADGKIKSVKEGNDYYRANGLTPESHPGVYRKTLDNLIEGVMNKDIEPTLKVQFARALTNPANQEEFAQYPKATQEKIFDQLTSPAFVAAMDPVKRANQQTADQFVSSIKTQFLGLYRPELGFVNESVNNRYLTIAYSPKEQTFYEVPQTPTQKSLRSENSPTASGARMEETRSVMNKLNLGLKKLIPVLQLSNPNTVPEQLSQVLSTAGIRLVMPQTSEQP